MRLQQTVKWLDPLQVAFAANLKLKEQDNLVFLYSKIKNNFTGRFSILAFKTKEELVLKNPIEEGVSPFDLFETKLSENKSKFDNAWFGFLSYDLKNSLEQLPEDSKYNISTADLWMVNYKIVIIFDHDNQTIQISADSENDIQEANEVVTSTTGCQDNFEGKIDSVSVNNLQSNMNKNEYLNKVNSIKESISHGDIYQANLTRKFHGNICVDKNVDGDKGGINPFNIFSRLCEVSPSPYSAFLKCGDKYIISSSPEQFLSVSEDGYVDTRPIKGSAKRFEDKQMDEDSREYLKNSDKDKAENLMIVDLSRNDLSRSCEVGSVKVKDLFKITSYSTIHHMASHIYGKKRNDVKTIDLVKNCFPPGSMTGAPKIKAMEICSQLEKVKRGVYSGAIGWFGGDGSVDLSVVIRTLIIDGNNFEFQVGGAIVSDSVAEKEWEETMVKATAISKVLGIEVEDLKNI